MIHVRDRTIPVKLAAERALVHVLQIDSHNEKNSILDQYLKSLASTSEASTAKSIGDYARRVLVKIASKESDAEDFIYD